MNRIARSTFFERCYPILTTTYDIQVCFTINSGYNLVVSKYFEENMIPILHTAKNEVMEIM